MDNLSLQEVSNYVSGVLLGSSDQQVSGVASLVKAKPGQISFCTSPKSSHLLMETAASVVLLQQDSGLSSPTAAIYVEDVYLSYAKLARLFSPPYTFASGVAASAVVDATAEIGEDVHIGAHAVISRGVKLGRGVQIGAGCVIGDYCEIGAGSRIHANVTLYHEVSMGEACEIYANAVIGSDGFGYAKDGDVWHKIPQTGRVRLGHRVHVGSSSTIDRGALDDTVLDDDVIIDSQVHLGHNVKVGRSTAMAACSGVSGSTTIGKHCQFAGQVAINGHIHITDHVYLTGCSMVIGSISEPGVYSSGMPALPNRTWRKVAAYTRQLDMLFKKVKLFEKVFKLREKDI